MRYSFIIAAILLGFTASAQINYGKEDCGPLFDRWIMQLERVKQANQDSVAGQPMVEFNKWIKEAKRDLAEGKYKILRRNPVTGGRPLFSVLDVLQTGNTTGWENLNAKDFLEFYETASPKEREIFKTLSLVFGAKKYEDDREQAGYSGMHYSEYVGIIIKEWEITEYEGVRGIIYKYLMDIIEDNRVADPEIINAFWYEKFSPFLKSFSGVEPPGFEDKQAVKQFFEQFAQPIQYGFGRMMLSDKAEPFYTEMESYNGPLGGNRYSLKYFDKLTTKSFYSGIESLIMHIVDLKKNFCAITNITELGAVKVEVTTEAAEQVTDNRESKEPTAKVPEGQGRLLIVAKTSRGRLLNSYDYNDFTVYPHNGLKPFTQFVNSWNLVLPGDYWIKNDRRPYDSVSVSIGEGETKSVDYVPGSAIKAAYKKWDGSIVPLDFRIDYLRPGKNGIYQYDTIYLGVSYQKNEFELNPGLYYVRPSLGGKFWPSMQRAEVVTEANSVSTVSVSGYGMLSVDSYDGLHKKNNVRVDIFTRNVNSKTGIRTALTYMNTRLDKPELEDTIYLAPGHYYMVAQYKFELGRDIEITADNLTREPIENMGVLLVTNGQNTNEYVEITDITTNIKRQVRNNTPIDLPGDKRYHVKVLKAGVKEQQVLVKPGEQATVRF